MMPLSANERKPLNPFVSGLANEKIPEMLALVPCFSHHLAAGTNWLISRETGLADCLDEERAGTAEIYPDIHVSRKSRENALLLTRASEEGAKTYKPDSSSHVCLAAVIPAFAEPDIHSLSRALAGRHR